MRRIDEQDEFLLSRLLDGELTDVEEAALRQRMSREPDLRQAFDQLGCLDALLAGRRGQGPHVDLARFHRDVMDCVAAESRPAVIRLGRWLKLGVPLAAAAAIALVVTLYRPVTKPGPADSVAIKTTPGTPGQVVPRTPGQGGDEPRFVVRYSRPETANDEGVVRVSYAQSAQLAKEMQERDDERRSRPTWHLFVAAASSPRAQGDIVLEMPPL